jgi:hypothetical protein
MSWRVPAAASIGVLAEEVTSTLAILPLAVKR